jgi:hypothetical protein
MWRLPATRRCACSGSGLPVDGAVEWQRKTALMHDDGYFEVMLPDLQRLPHGERMRAFDKRETHWGIDEYDVLTQQLTSHHIRIVDGKAKCFSLPSRYVWPAELDLMAEIAGMSLKERWGGWRREPFTVTSRSHVSVWQKPSR